MQSILLLRIAVDSPEFQAKSNVTSEWYLSFDIVLPRLHMHRRPIKLIPFFFSLLCTTSDHYPFFFNPDFFSQLLSKFVTVSSLPWCHYLFLFNVIVIPRDFFFRERNYISFDAFVPILFAICCCT